MVWSFDHELSGGVSPGKHGELTRQRAQVEQYSSSRPAEIRVHVGGRNAHHLPSGKRGKRAGGCRKARVELAGLVGSYLSRTLSQA